MAFWYFCCKNIESELRKDMHLERNSNSTGTTFSSPIKCPNWNLSSNKIFWRCTIHVNKRLLEILWATQLLKDFEKPTDYDTWNTLLTQHLKTQLGRIIWTLEFSKNLGKKTSYLIVMSLDSSQIWLRLRLFILYLNSWPALLRSASFEKKKKWMVGRN